MTAVLLAVLLPFLAAAIWYLSYRVGNTRAVHRLEAKARKRGEPLTLAELAAKFPPIPDDENVAVALLELWKTEDPAFWQAFLAAQRPLPTRKASKIDPNLPILGTKAARLSRTERITPAALAAAEAYLKSHAAHMEAVRAALRRPRCRFPIRVTEGFAALLPHVALLTSEAQHFRLDALVATERGDMDSAITALGTSASVGLILTNEPFVIGALVRIACFTMVIDGAELLLSRRELAVPQLDQLESVVDQLKMFGLLRAAYVSERASFLSVFELSSEASRRLAIEGEATDAKADEAGWRVGLGVMAAIGLAGSDRRLMLESFDEAIDLSEKITPEALQRIQQIFEGARAKSREFPPKIFSGLLLGADAKIATRFASLEARRRAAVTALAVQRYRLVHANSLPEQLDDLVPQSLPAVLLDPFDGQPLRYRRLTTGFVVYSIGADRHDNGGKERPAQRVGEPFDDTFIVER